MICKICPKRKKEKIEKLLDNITHVSAIEAFYHHPNKIIKIQKQLNICFVVFRKTKSLRYLLFDGSQTKLALPKKCCSISIFGNRLVTKKVLVNEKFPITPFIRPKVCVETNLAVLLSKHLTGLSNKHLPFLTPPCDYKSTKQMLINLNLWGYIQILFVTCFLPKKIHVNWINCDNSEQVVAVLEAFTGKHFQLTFAPYTVAKRNYKKYEKTNVTTTTTTTTTDDNLLNKKNMSSSVSLSLCGLTNAYCLGVLDKENLIYLSNQLQFTYIALWIHLDINENARHISCYDGEQICKNFEITLLPTEEQPDLIFHKYYLSWNTFFDYLWNKHNILCSKKQQILQPLLTILEKNYNNNINSKFKQCYQQLKKFIAKTKVIIFAPNDKIMHAIKMPFAYFAEQKKIKRFRGILLKTDAKNTLTSISTSFMQIDNVVQFFGVNSSPQEELIGNYNDDIDFKHVAKDWIDLPNLQNNMPMPIIDCHTNLLRSQLVYSPGKIIPKSKFLKSYLNNRGNYLTYILYQLFAKFCQFFLYKYNIELQTWPITSFPCLAFNSVWLQYNILGGPFLQGPEKIKKAYEMLLRKHSKGGFSWSFTGQISSGDCLNFNSHCNVTPKTTAKSVVEFDICSSYGYAGANMSCPSAFCVGYSSSTNKNAQLVKCDRFRHKSYEFRATYFYLFCLLKTGTQILSVYSNYHVLGIFTIGKYPIDLVIITKNCGIFVVQFDHLYTHGCRQGCNNLPKYVNNKLRQQLESQSQERDNVITEWINTIKEIQIVYHVISECHTAGFDMKNLNSAFLHEFVLNQLVKPYLCLPKHIFTLDVLSKLDPNLTFIMFCQGHIPKENFCNLFPPVFVWKTDHNQTYCQDFSHQTVSNTMLSQDHYNYLVQEHNFKIDSVSEILFFKKYHILPQMFDQLIQERYKANYTSSKINVIKSLVNFACGYFGMNVSKQKKTSNNKRLVTGFKFKENFNNIKIDGVGQFNEKIYFTRQWLRCLSSNANRLANSPLAIFCCIIDFGKIRLGQCFTFIESIAKPNSVKLAYSHIDNMVLILSENCFDNIVTPNMWKTYQVKKSQFFHQSHIQKNPLPGQLKEEFFVCSSNWNFVSPYTCFYALINCEQNKCKMSSVSNISPEESYQCALKYLNKTPVYVNQQRRINKLANTKKQIVTFQLKTNKNTVVL